MAKTFAPTNTTQAARSTRNLPVSAAPAQAKERMLGNRRNAQQNMVLGKRNDRYERQADAVAEQYSPASDPVATADMSIGDAPAPQLQLKSLANATPSNATASLSKLGAGQPLSVEARQPLEQHLGYRFDQVRVHTGAAAAGSAQRMHARAYTSGSHVVFGRSEYAPHTPTGQKLLAHELTHVVQQGAASGAPDIQRAETDEEVGCSGLVDCSADINAEVNRVLGAAVAAAGTPVSADAVVNRAASDLGGSSVVSPIEGWAETALPAKKIHQAAIPKTRYGGAENALWMGFSRVLGPIVKIGSICVGTDKLGHFFQQGFQYFKIARRLKGGSVALAEAFGRESEIEGSGLGQSIPFIGTRVFSNADLDANRKGLQFYDDLLVTPTMKFAISDYANTNWNEQNLPNFYTSSMATIVWNNLLGNFPWRGIFNNNFTGVDRQPVELDFSVSSTGITATYEYMNAGVLTTGTISNVNISQRTKTVTGLPNPAGATVATPVSGIDLTFDWTEGGGAGKGVWQSGSEHILDGFWGRGSSRTDGGVWNLRRS